MMNFERPLVGLADDGQNYILGWDGKDGFLCYSERFGFRKIPLSKIQLNVPSVEYLRKLVKENS